LEERAWDEVVGFLVRVAGAMDEEEGKSMLGWLEEEEVVGLDIEACDEVLGILVRA
jgi:hypothetical protein